MIKFKYNLNAGLINLIRSTIVDYGDEYIIGILEDSSKYQLSKMGIFLVCEENTVNRNIIYSNPLAVVAKNQSDAIRIYYDYTGKDASVMCDLEAYANKAKVEPLD